MKGLEIRKVSHAAVMEQVLSASLISTNMIAMKSYCSFVDYVFLKEVLYVLNDGQCMTMTNHCNKHHV
jgi:hypothetical protein